MTNDIVLVDNVLMPTPASNRAEEIKRFILENVDNHPSDIARITGAKFGLSRQAVNLHLKSLQREELISREGKTRGTTYRRTEREVVLPVEGLREDEVYRDHVALVLTGLPENVLQICEYGVTEMVNNVLDHSRSPKLTIRTKRTIDEIKIVIIDVGIGIFRKIQQDCNLEDVRHAVFELTKGKLTTDPKHHTGEGIFFTSRMFDQFILLSHGLSLAHSRQTGDWLVEVREGEDLPGTIVQLKISPQASQRASEVFDRYASEQDDYAFSKTHVVVKLSQTGEETFVSRSQAKRIVARLEKFKEVILDFSGIQEIGPAFADEIFRVFVSEHPDTHLIPVNMNEMVTKMVRRAQAH